MKYEGFTPDQKRYLREKYDENPNVGRYDIHNGRIGDIIDHLKNMGYNRDLPPLKISTWFKNERQRRRRKILDLPNGKQLRKKRRKNR